MVSDPSHCGFPHNTFTSIDIPLFRSLKNKFMILIKSPMMERIVIISYHQIYTVGLRLNIMIYEIDCYAYMYETLFLH